MRKFVFVLVVVALLLAVLAWRISSVRSSALEAEPVPTPSALDVRVDSIIDLQEAGSSSATSLANVDAVRTAIEAPVPTAAMPEITGTNRCALRVIVRFGRSQEFVPDQLDAFLFDDLRQPSSFDRLENNTFLFSNLATGTYLLNVRERSSTPATTLVKLDVPGEVRTVEITMAPLRCISVRWRTPDGRPFARAMVGPALEPDGKMLAVSASNRPLQQDAMDNASSTFSQVLVFAAPDATFDEEFGLMAGSGDGISSPGARFDLAFDPSEPDRFCRLYVGAVEELWLSAWNDGVLSGSQHVKPDQTEVVFTSSLEELRSPGVPVSLCLVDDKTSLPVTHARIDTDGRIRDIEPDEHGCCAFDLAPGWAVLYLDGAPEAWEEGMRMGTDEMSRRSWLSQAPSRLSVLTMRVFARQGEPLDLGVIRMPRARVLRFRVLDPDLHPATDVEINLARWSSYDRTSVPYESRRRKTDALGLVVFEMPACETYVVGCVGGHFDSEPLIVDARSVSDDPDTIAGRILLRPLRSVTIAFDPRPSRGTIGVVETPEGLPVWTEQIDETGLVSFPSGGDSYMLHLVEGGKIGRDVPFTVDSNPFLFTMHR